MNNNPFITGAENFQEDYVTKYRRENGLLDNQQDDDENGYLSSLGSGFAGGALGVAGSLADAGSTILGTDGSVGKWFNEKAQQFAKPQGKEYGWREILDHPLDYATDPSGLTYDVGQFAGSSAALAGTTAAAGAAMPAGTAGAITAAIGSKLPWLGKVLSGTATGNKFLNWALKQKALQPIPEAIAEGGSTARQMADENGGNLSDYRKEAATTAALNAGVLSFTNALETAGLGDLIAKSGGKDAVASLLGSVLKGAAGGAASNAYEEGAQSMAADYAMGKGQSVADVFNPFGWNEAAKDAAAIGGAGGAVLGGVGVAGGKAINRLSGNNNENSENNNNTEAIADEKKRFINAIAGQESGGNYDAINGRTGASGKYQIMPENWPSWAEEAGIGADAEMTPENQEIVARYKLGEYYDKYGKRGAAIAWYGGEGALDYSEEALNRKQGNGNEPSINEYADSVLHRMGGSDNLLSGEDEYVPDEPENEDTAEPKQENAFEDVSFDDNTKTAKEKTFEQQLDELKSRIDLAEAEEAERMMDYDPDNTAVKQFTESKVSRKSYPKYDVKGNAYIGRYSAEKLKKVAAMNDTKLINLAHSVATFDNSDNLKRTVANELNKRGITTGNDFVLEQPGNVAVYNDNKKVANEADVTGERITKGGDVSTVHAFGRDRVQQYVDKYMGNPQSFNADYKKAGEGILQAYKAGRIGEAEARQYLRSLDELYPQVMEAINNNGVIRQNGRMVQNKLLQSNAERRNRQKSDKINSIINKARAAKGDVQGINRALGSADMAKLTERAIGGDHAARRAFDGMRPEIREALMARREANRYIPKSEDEWQAEQRDIDQMMQDIRSEYQKEKNPTARRKVLKAELTANRKQYEAMLKPAIDVLRSGMGNGAELIPAGEGKEGRSVRMSNNRPWYTKFRKDNNRPPNRRELEDMAFEMLTGQNAYSNPEYAFDSSDEALAHYDDMRSQLNGYRSLIDTLEELDNEAKAEEAKAREEKKAEAKKNGKADNQKARESTKGKDNNENAVSGRNKKEQADNKDKGADDKVPVNKKAVSVDVKTKEATVSTSGEGYDSTTATTATPTLTRRNRETVASSTNSIAQEANKRKITVSSDIQSTADQLLKYFDAWMKDGTLIKSYNYYGNYSQRDKHLLEAMRSWDEKHKAYLTERTLSNKIAAAEGYKHVIDTLQEMYADFHKTGNARVNDAIKQLYGWDKDIYGQSLDEMQKAAKADDSEVKATFSDSSKAEAALADALGLKRKTKAEPQKAFNVVDDSDAALDAALADLRKEMSKLSANPVFNPDLHKAAFKVGMIYLQRGVNSFAAWSDKMVEAVGEKIRPWLGSIWKSIEAYPKNEKLDPDLMSKAVDFTGAKYGEGYRSAAEIYNYMADTFGEEEVRPYKGLIESAYAGIDELYHPTMEADPVVKATDDNSTNGKTNVTDENTKQQENVKNNDITSYVREWADKIGVDAKMLQELINAKPTEANINEYGRFDALKSSVDKQKAKEYFDGVRRQDLPMFRVNTLLDLELRKVIHSYAEGNSQNTKQQETKPSANIFKDNPESLINQNVLKNMSNTDVDKVLDIFNKAEKPSVSNDAGEQQVVKAEFNLNDKLNGIEIKFKEKPEAEIIAKLKAAGYRYSITKRFWYSKQNKYAMKVAESIGYKPADVVQSKQEETAKEEKADDAKLQRPTASPDSEPAGTRPDTGERDMGGSVQAPQGERDAGTGAVERKVEKLTPAQKKNAKAKEVPGHNFTITESDEIGKGGPKAKYKDNIEAIKLLKQLEAESRLATPEEQKVLAHYVGWGGLSPVFNIYGRGAEQWQAEQKELRELLTREEYEAARASVNNAHYTSPEVIKGVWDIVGRLGFKGGRVLEPSMGIGNFFGMMPEAMRNKSALNGVELDSITGRIAKQLYQKANVEISGYETTKYPDNFFDLTISNVPFGDYKLNDPKYNKYKFNIHNYFFAKAVDQTRPGGLIAFITSTGTMQSGADSMRLRQMLQNKVDFIGALRLPNTAFRENAGTDVTTDLIILQKREDGAAAGKNNQPWLETVDTEVRSQIGGRPLAVNEYYSAHPDMLLGKLVEDKLYGNRLALDGTGVDVAAEMAKRIEKFPANIYKPLTGKRNLNSVESAKAAFLAPAKTRNDAYLEKDGKVYRNENGSMVELPQAEQKRALHYVALRDATKNILAAQIDPATKEETLKELRDKLNKVYDTFVDKYGYINENKNVKALSLDPEYGIVSAIEKYEYDKKTKKAKAAKRDIFTKRTVNAIVQVDKADTPADALALSLTNTGAVNIDYMAKLMGKKPQEVVKSLDGMIYENPESRLYETADEYLSGNVREKLEYAEEAAKQDKAYEKNVQALKKVQPKDLLPEEISVSLGTPWIPAADIEKFAAHLMDMPFDDPVNVKFVPQLGTWAVSWNSGWRVNAIKDGTNSTVTWGTKRRNFKDVLDDALNQRSPVVYDTDTHGNKTVNDKETTLAQQKVKEVQTEFKKWIWSDEERTKRLAGYYNRNYNNWRLREYNGSHLTMPGYSAVEPQLRPHQKDAIWRMMQNGNTLLAHCVGAGKTWTMQAGAMEMKRLGIAKKPMFVIPNHMLQQFENEFRRIYPNAKLLTISSENLPDVTIPNAKNLSKAELARRRAAKNAARQSILGRIATEDWDGIIISHNMFKRIPMSEKAYADFYRDQIEEMSNAIIELNASEGRSGNRMVKELEKRKKALEEKLKQAMNEENKDIVIPFEQLGVDQLFVDEADMFKNLFFVTKMTRIAGLSNTNSQRSTDMFMKTQYLTKANGGRGVVFATGTPISNTMAEMFTMLRYLDMQGLKEKDMAFFDNWAANFANRETTIERSPDGQGYRQTEKFTSFTNMPELIKMFRKVADVKTQEDLQLDIPKLKNGKPTVVEIAPNDALTNYIKNVIAKRAEAIHERKVDPSEDNMLKLTSDLRKASLDMRLVDPTVPAQVAESKIKAVADHVYDKYVETKDVKGTQLVFCDLSTPKAASDKVNETDGEAKDGAEEGENITAYEEIKKMLVKQGVPSKEIAFIHDAKTKDQKEQLFEKVRNGEVRVLIGSTEKMGAGTNIQDKLVALHHVDAPWRPRDIEQREGRILRQGNENKEVEIFNYVTKDSFDANMWEKLKNKASMINQAMSNNLSNRVIEDMDANVLTFAEVEALASGNPLMAERTMVNAELNKYETLHAAYTRAKAAAQRRTETIPANIKQMEILAQQAKADIKKRSDITKDNFSITLGKKTYTSRVDAKAAVEKLVGGYDNEAGGVVGNIGGFDLRLKLVKAGSVFSSNGKVYTASENAVRAELVGNLVYNSEASLQSMEYNVMHGPERALETAQRSKDSLEKELSASRQELGKPFEYEAKYNELKQRSAELEKELGIGEDNAPKYSVSDEKAVQRTFKELEAEARAALPNIKDVQYEGNDMIFTMPNDRKIRVSIEDELILNESGRRQHNIASGTDAIAEGYWQKLDAKGIDGVLALAKEGRKGTAYHEALHAAIDLVLTDKEKAALIKHYQKAANEQVIDIEEAIAEGYREWVLARQKGKGTMFGKLYAKMQDFWNKIKLLLTGTENAHEVMRRIESGEVWNRSGESTGAGTRYSVTNSQITGETRIPVIDVTGLPQVDVNNNNVKIAIAKSLIGKDFRIIGSSGIGRIASLNDGKHFVNSSNNIKRTDPVRRQALSAAEDVLNNAVYVEKHLDDKHGSNARYIELYAVVKSGNDLTRFRLVAKEGNKTAGEYEIKEAKFYDIIKEGTPTIAIPQMGMQSGSVPSTISVAELLTGVKDRQGNPYVNADGGLNYESAALNGIKYSVAKKEQPVKPLTSSQKVAQAFTNTERKNAAQTIKDWVHDKRKNLYRDWIDKNDSLHGFDEAMEMGMGRKLSDDEKIYNKAQTLAANSAGMANALIEGGRNNIEAINKRLKKKKLKYQVTLSMVMAQIGRGKMDNLYPRWLEQHSEFKSWIDAFGAYLGCERLLEMNKLAKEAGEEYKLPRGMTEADLQAYVRSAPKEFKKAAEMYYMFNDNVLTVMEDAGLISEKVHNELTSKYKHYCPLMRDFSDTAAADAFIGGLGNGGRGIGNVSTPLKRINIEGSTRNVLNPLESTIKAVSVVCNRAERNKVGQMAVNMAKEAGLENLVVEVPGGKNDPKNCIFTVLEDGKKVAYQTTQDLYGPIVGYNLPAAGFMLGIARNAARLLRAGSTMSPSFIVRNLIRDTIFAGISSQNGFVPILDTLRGGYALWKNSKMRAEFETAGVTQFNFYGSNEAIAKSLDEMAGGKKWQEYGPADIWRAIMKYPAMGSEFVESATRMGEFMKARQRGASIDAAARAARELTLDFSRSGVTGEKVNQVIPFFNACLQGGDKFIRLWREHPMRTAQMLGMYIVLPSIILWCMNHDEDWYKELDPAIKNSNWCLPGGIRIPKPQDAGILFGSGIEAVLDEASGIDKKAIANWADTFRDNMTPGIIPTVFLPILEWQANYSYFRGGALVNRRLQQLPDEQQYTNSTSEASKFLGRVTGLSPVKIDNTIRGYTGTMGMFMWQTADWFAAEKQNLPAKKLSEMQFIRDFNINDNLLNRSVNEFYELLENANKQHAGYGVKGKPSRAVQQVRTAAKMISDLNKDIQKITNSRLSPDEKRERIDKKREQIKRISQIAVTKYSKYFE